MQPTTSQPQPTPPTPNNPSQAPDHMSKWVINLSRAPLTNDQLSLLQKGPNFAITPKYPPLDAYITATEVAAAKLNTQEAEEFRSDVSRLLKQHQHQTQCNLNPAQCRALTQLKQDNTRVILTADKGVAMVVMDKGEYTSKAQALLDDTSTYKVLNKDPPHNSKPNLSISSKVSNSQVASVPISTNNSSQPVQSLPSSMAFPKFKKQVHPSGPLFPVGGQLHMGWLRSSHTLSNP